MSDVPDKMTYSAPEAARKSGFNLKVIYSAMESGALKSHLKPPNHRNRFIRHQDLQAFVDAQPEA